MPFLNEEDEPQNTINSIYETSDPKMFNIIVINDCSDKSSDIAKTNEITYIKNETRIGVDACRQKGADMSYTPCLMIIDSHMRFKKGWMEQMIQNISNNPKTLWCTKCVGLGYGNMDINRSRDNYYGADFVVENSDNEILEPKWRNARDYGAYEIPCILGANYGVSKKWFDYIHGLKGLKMWGCSEIFMSLKTWMAGGGCKIDTNIEIGHKFRDSAPYSTGVWNMIYNKIYLCKTILPVEIGDYLIDKIPKTVNYKRAMKEIDGNLNEINKEREYYNAILKLGFKDLCKKWDVKLPI